jgi:hypothetical protein
MIRRRFRSKEQARSSGGRNLSVGKSVLFLLIAIVAGSSSNAYGETISIGSHYLHATDGFYPFPGGVGTVAFHGRPFGPGNTDTIYQRLAEANLPTLGSSATIPIEVVRLEMQSFSPVNIGGTFFDMFIHLTPGTRSLGEMTITQNSPNDGGPAPEGTFHKSVTLVFTAEFTPVGGGPGGFVVNDSVFIATVDPAPWSFDPDLNFVTVTTGPLEQQTANFFVTGERSIFMLNPTATAGGHKQSAEIPEPATMLLLGTGLAGVAIKMRRRLKSHRSGQGAS